MLFGSYFGFLVYLVKQTKRCICISTENDITDINDEQIVILQMLHLSHSIQNNICILFHMSLIT